MACITATLANRWRTYWECIQCACGVQIWSIETLSIHVQICNNTSDRKHADSVLEGYVTETVMSIVTTFFSSPFSDQSTSLQVNTRTGIDHN